MGSLEDAAAHHRAGRLQQAATGYVSVLNDDPEHADALHLLGLVMHRLGHPADGLDLMDRALAVDRRHAPCLANRALVLRALDRDDEALDSLRRALRVRPGFFEALLTRARIQLDLRDLQAAERSCREALRQRPDDTQAREVLAHVLGWDDRAPEAAEILEGTPHHALRGRLLLAAGDANGAVHALAEALMATPRERSAAVALGDALTQVAEPPTDLQPALLAAMALDGVDHQRLERAVRAALIPDRDDPAALAVHPLTQPWLRNTLIGHPDWETAARALRDHLFDHRDTVDIAVLVAMALHGWHNEYAWPTPPRIAAACAQLDLDDPRQAAAAAMYAPLDIRWDIPSPPAELFPLVQACHAEPAAEHHLGPDIPTVSLTDDATSAAVRAMYEDNPYPRLVSVSLRSPRPLEQILRGHVARPPPVPERRLQVLVAGCGTGQHPLQTATTFQHVDVVAVDLSRASLARAQRRADDLQVDNITFLHGDVLGLTALAGPFDLVESVGVLHHLDDPVAGWRVLRDLTRPGGLMRIGLYAERGRSEVVAGRALVDSLALSPTPDGLRTLREAVRALPDEHPARPLVWSPDFTNLSGVRDLVFHVREHRFTLPQLSEIIADLGLTFLGFQHGQGCAAALYSQRWPDDVEATDLHRWEALEAGHPRLFSGMYVMWLHR